MKDINKPDASFTPIDNLGIAVVKYEMHSLITAITKLTLGNYEAFTMHSIHIYNMHTYMLHFALSFPLQKSGVQVGAHSASKAHSEIYNNFAQCGNLSISILYALTATVLLTAH